MAAKARTPDDRRADELDPHTREIKFGERLDSGRGWPWRRDDDDRGTASEPGRADAVRAFPAGTL